MKSLLGNIIMLPSTKRRWTIYLSILIIVLWSPAKSVMTPIESAVDLLTHHTLHDAVLIVPGGSWYSSPALADINGDGELEIIAAVSRGWIGAWHRDGRLVAGWPRPYGAYYILARPSAISSAMGNKRS